MPENILRCPTCRSSVAHTRGCGVTCDSCGRVFPERHGILDLLGDPPEAIRTELRGLAKEIGIDVAVAGYDSIKFFQVAEVASTAELMDASRGRRVQYYQQTTATYFEALARAQVDAHMRVAEIGSELSLWKLRVIEDLCDEAYALNIMFHVGANPATAATACRVLGDMNDLPFVTGSLDLLLYSATLHHSVDVEGALHEAHRVLRPGGRAIVVNEPIAGFAKRLGGPTGHNRDEEIHEDEVTFRAWRRAIRRSGLMADDFVPAWFVGQVRAGADLPPGTRFARLGAGLSPLMRRATAADLLRAVARVPAQAVLGLPLNAVLWKAR